MKNNTTDVLRSTTRPDTASRNVAAPNYAEMRPRPRFGNIRTKTLALCAALIGCIGATAQATASDFGNTEILAELASSGNGFFSFVSLRPEHLLGAAVCVVLIGYIVYRISRLQPAVAITDAQPIRIADLDLEMLPIPAGSFIMGSPESEPGRSSVETQHRVTLTKPFWLGKYPVTQGQYEKLMGNNPSNFTGVGKDAPVEWVSWNNAMAFCEKLTEQERSAGRLPEGYEYTLPSESEWEWSCRAGTTTPFNTGNNLTTAQGNYDGNYPYNGNAKGEYRRTTTKVGSFSPNAWGLYDMHGNVWEWCSDWYGYYPSGDVTDPVDTASGGNRVIRGGSWRNSAQLCRSAYRNGIEPGYRYYLIGFRLALKSVR